MTEEAIFVDSTVFLAFFIEDIDAFKEIKDKEFFTSINVIEEVAYVLIKERAKDVSGIEKHYDLLSHLRENSDLVKEISKEILSDISTVVEKFKIEILLPAPHLSMFEVVEIYGLLPNDALIAATCKHYGIKKIATFDNDFKRVDFLEVVDFDKL